MLKIMWGFVTFFFFYFLETVFDACLIFVEENPNNQTELWQNNTGHVCLYVCMHSFKETKKEISVVLADAQTHPCTEPSCLMIDTLL